MNVVECFRNPQACAIEPACALIGVLGRALAAFLEVLDGYTLRDLVKKPAPLAALLELGARKLT